MIDATLELERGRSKIVKVAYTETGSQALVRVRIRVNSKIIKVACTEMGSQVLRCHRVEMWRAACTRGDVAWFGLGLGLGLQLGLGLCFGLGLRFAPAEIFANARWGHLLRTGGAGAAGRVVRDHELLSQQSECAHPCVAQLISYRIRVGMPTPIYLSRGYSLWVLLYTSWHPTYLRGGHGLCPPPAGHHPFHLSE